MLTYRRADGLRFSAAFTSPHDVLPHVNLLPAASMRMLPVAAGVNRVSRFGRAPFLHPGHGLSRRRAQPGSTLATGHRRRRRAAGLSQASTAAASAGLAWV